MARFAGSFGHGAGNRFFPAAEESIHIQQDDAAAAFAAEPHVAAGAEYFPEVAAAGMRLTGLHDIPLLYRSPTLPVNQRI